MTKGRKPPRCEYRVELKLRYGAPQSEDDIKDFLWEVLREHVNTSRTDGGLVGAYTLEIYEKTKSSAVVSEESEAV